MAENLPFVIDKYIKVGDPENMEKVKQYFSSKDFDFNNLTPEYIQSFPLQRFAHWIAAHLNVDSETIHNDSDKTRHQESFITIIKYVFVTFYSVLKRGKIALKFVSDFEDALDEAQTIQGGLEILIEAMPFSKLKDDCLDITAPLNPSISKSRKVSFQWLKDEIVLQKLSQLLHGDYGIIRAPSRFEKLMKGTTNKRVTINRDKVGYFVFLIKKLIEYKWVRRKGGKGHWIFLTQITIDYSGKEIAETKNFFKSLSSKLGKDTVENTQIINQIEEILKEAERVS